MLENEVSDLAPETLDVLYRDQHLIAVHKPAGLLVHRSMIDRHETRFAMQIVREQIGKYVYTVHRLDKPTSGVLLFALSSDIAREMTDLFTRGLVSKEYRAVVRGYAPEGGLIDYPLKEKLDKIADKKARTDKPAQPAKTEFKRLSQFEVPIPVRPYASARYSYVELYPKTGRKHQIRRHLSHINHPILGDVNHGDGKHNAMVRKEFSFNGLALWATQMQFPHPVTGDRIKIESRSEPRIQNLLSVWQQNKWENQCQQ